MGCEQFIEARIPQHHLRTSAADLHPGRHGRREGAARVRELLAKYQEIELLVQIGEYQAGSDPLADTALRARAALREFATQRSGQLESYDDTVAHLAALRSEFGQDHREADASA